MKLQDYLGHDPDRRVCIFSMTDGDEEVQFGASWELMDEIDRGWGASAEKRAEQFDHIKEALIAIARKKVLSLHDGERQDEVLLSIEDRELYL